MEPLDPTWNGEGSAYSRRRVSSILKAPRKSCVLPDSEQQENRVECAKTMEKRISRRVSFAATNNVLLFSNDAKSDSSAISPLQDLMTTAGKQRRTQVAFTEDLSQQAAKETLMRASLHTSEPWDKGNFDTRDNIGEKTLMFGTDDAFMDMTQSHSVHLATGADLFSDMSLHNNQTTSREKTQIFAADDGSMDMTLSHTSKMATVPGFRPSLESNVENKSTSSSVACLDADFEDFLASLFKQSSSSANPEDTRVATSSGTSSEEANLLQIKAPKCHLDKENQPPAPLMERSLKAIRKRGPSSGSGAMDVTRVGDEFMDMTRSHTVTVTGEPLASPTQSQMRGKMRHVSTQEEEQKETYPMSSNKCADIGFKAAVSTTSVPGGSSEPPAKMKTSSVSFLSKGDGQTFDAATSTGGEVDREDDVTMDMTEAKTQFITGWNDDQVFLPSQSQQKDHNEILDKPSSSNSAGMDVSWKPAIKMKTNEHKFKFDAEDDGTDNMVRFSGQDACMDVTESCTGSIANEVAAQSVFAQSCNTKKVDRTFGQRHSLALKSSCFRGTETMLTAALKPKVDQVRPHTDEKTVRFSADDACMDVTQCQTVNIVNAPDTEAPQNSDSLSACRDRTVTFSANAADMDVTQCLTGNIAAGQILDTACNRGDRTVTLPVDMDVTQCQMDNTGSRWDTNLVPRKRDSLFLYSRKEQNFPFCAKGSENQITSDCPPGNRPSMGRALNPGFKSLSKSSAAWANPVVVKAAAATLVSADSADKQVQDHIVAKTEPSRVVPAVLPPEEDMAEAQSNATLGQERSDEQPQCALSTQASPSYSVETTDTEASAPQEIGSPKVVAPSRESKRMSFADLQSKVRRLSHMVNAAPGHTAPLPQLEIDLDWDSKDGSQPMNEPELDVASGKREDDMRANCSMEEDSVKETPFKLKSAELVSRLSMGGFKPRLPQRAKSNDVVKATPVGGHARTVTPGIASELPGLDCNVSDLYDEELGSCDDVSEILETESTPHKATETARVSQELAAGGLLEDQVFQEGHASDTNIKKRPLTSDEDNEEQKKKRVSTEMVSTDVDSQLHHGEIDSYVAPAACVLKHTTVDEYNSSQTASGRYEATFESTWKQSLFESHFEDYADDMQNKFDDGTITVKEFFKIFNIDFVIHNPRQSILPERLSDTERTPMDLLKDRYICRPKQQVYENDILSLTEKVDGLKGRMQDLDRPLQIVNRSLWEEICSFSEDELKSFGAKLKEQNNLFRKRSKAQSHEMKEVLYSNIVQANEEVQQILREKMDEADEMIKSLDDCIDELKTELTAVEEKGSEDLPSLKWCQEEMARVTGALADRERRALDLESQNEQNAKKLDKLKTETKNLQSHVSTLHLLTEWRIGESSDNSTAFTFLYKTFNLQVVYGNGNVADKPSERKIIEISFKHEIDEEKMKDYGHLVHKLLSLYTEGERAWVEKYPTSRHVPLLLQDVSLVVSSCRLLGEELRLLNTWGGMSFAVLSISCVDTRVHFVFSSLKNLSKFEVTFSTSLTEEAYALNVQSFKNKYGSTTVQQIEEIVASFSPCKNLLTKIVQKIHSSLLC